MSPSEQSNANHLLLKESDKSQKHGNSVLSSSSNMKTTYRGNELMKLTNEKEPVN